MYCIISNTTNMSTQVRRRKNPATRGSRAVHETVTVCKVDGGHTHRVDGFPGDSAQYGHHPSSGTGRLLANVMDVLGAVLRLCSAT